MSKKNLARSTIEGGRYKRSKYERRNSHNEERCSEREYCHQAKLDPDSVDEYDIVPKRKAYKDFKDKLSPMYRWLFKQIGRPWNDVYSEITSKFDTRTTAGRHIVYDHLLSSVDLSEKFTRYRIYVEDNTVSYNDYSYYVDEVGILCKRKYLGRKACRYHEPIPKFNTNQLCNWLNGRIIDKIGNKYFWFIPSDRNHKYNRPDRHWKSVWNYPSYNSWYDIIHKLSFIYLAEKPVYKFDNMGNRVLVDGIPIITRYKSEWVCCTPLGFRQGCKLDAKEAEYWNSVPEYYQKAIMTHSPNYVAPPESKNNKYY